MAFDSEGTRGGPNIRRHLGGNDLVSSSVLSPEASSAFPSDTFTDLSGNVLSTASRLQWLTTRLTAGRTVAGRDAEVTAPKARLGQFAASLGFENACAVLAVRGEVNHVNAPESRAILCQLSVTHFGTCNRQMVVTDNGNLNFRRSASASQTIAGVNTPAVRSKRGRIETDVIADRICPRAAAQGSQEVGRAETFFSTVAIKEEEPHD
jgi:hypothetical protein